MLVQELLAELRVYDPLGDHFDFFFDGLLAVLLFAYRRLDFIDFVLETTFDFSNSRLLRF